MAEGGVSLSAGSDVIFDFFCETCIEDGRQLEAEGFCEDCREYLCGSCYSAHQKTRFTRHHALQDKTSMPKDTPLSQDRVNKDIETKCDKHSGEPVKYYCTTHRVFGCSTCFVGDHRGCQDIISIVKESETILDSSEYNGVVASLQCMRTRSRDVEKLARANKVTSQKCCKDVVSSVRQQTENAITILREHEKCIVTLAEQQRSEEDERMDSVLKECDVMSEKTEQLFSTFESLQSSKRVCQLYITMKETETDVNALQQTIDKLEKTDVARTFRFEPNVDVMSRLLESPDVLGKITHDDRDNDDVRPPSSSSPRIVTATSLADIDNTPVNITRDEHRVRDVVPPSSSPSSNVTAVKLADIGVTSDGGENFSMISGSAVMNDNKLIITDWFNNKLQLIDTSTNTLTATLDVTKQPWDVAAINQHRAVVTLPSNKALMVVKVTDTLVKEKEIPVRKGCRGVAYSQDRIFVTYECNPRLEILDLCGTVIRTIDKDSDGRQLFAIPYYVCVSKDGETVYVSDHSQCAVTSLTLDGVVKAVYKDKELGSNGKVCTDHHGNVYVCGVASQNAHMLTADLRKVKVILTRADGLGNAVWSVSHCQDTHRLFIGMSSNMIKSYQLS